MVEVLAHRALHSITTDAMQTTFQTLSFYCLEMFWLQLLTRNTCTLNQDPIDFSFQ